jgi:hypothetical protein
MSSLPKTQKYIMFLNPVYFKKNFFKSFYNKIKKRLENKGIILFNIDCATNEIIKRREKTLKNRTSQLTFDGLSFPNVNTLYIHLFGNQYYSDTLYNKKKIEMEREMLFLLAGKLGVKIINYETEIVETTISRANANIKIKGMNTSTNFCKNIKISKGSRGQEEYINRGATVYLKYNTIEEVERNIENKMDSDIFNYSFYKNSQKLQNFVYKRFEFKMQKLDYMIETEDISDLSFAVKTCFIDYGIDVSFDKSMSYYENVHYKLEFFTDDELKTEFGKKIRYYKDKFYTTREYYDLIDDKDKAVHFITEYVMEYANNYHYVLNDVDDDRIHNFSKHIQNFIKINEPGKFETVCHDFQSTSQIRNWINKEFVNDNMEIINEMDITDKNIQDVIKEDKQYNSDKMSVILPFEKKEYSKEDNNINELQYQLEYIAKENTDELELESKLKIIIENKPNIEETEINKELDNNNLIHYSSSHPQNSLIFYPPALPPRIQQLSNDEYLSVVAIDNKEINFERPPVFPTSSTTSINSVFETEQRVLVPNFPPPPPPSLSSDA